MYLSFLMRRGLSYRRGRIIMITPREELSVVTPADWVPRPPQGSWTYEDYTALPDEEHYMEVDYLALKCANASES